MLNLYKKPYNVPLGGEDKIKTGPAKLHKYPKYNRLLTTLYTLQ